MPRHHHVKIDREVEIDRTPRVIQVESIFDVPPEKASSVQWDFEFEIPDEWSVGLVVGPSGCGKSTLARELWPDHVVTGFDWGDGSILDSFPDVGIKTITGALSHVGFSAVPSWLRPYRVLSTGQKFRADLARAMCEQDLIVFDEFTSVVDRTVAKIGSAAVAKAVRRSNKQLIGVSCHYDIIEWMEPDWVLDMQRQKLLPRGSLQRPDIEIEIQCVHPDAWQLFRHHHYLTASLSPAARCYVGFVDGAPAVFTAVTHFPHRYRKACAWRNHRTVCLPDYQGVGIGSRFVEAIAAAYRCSNKRFTETTSHPGLIKSRNRSPNWAVLRSPSRVSKPKGSNPLLQLSANRVTATFVYLGPKRPDYAEALGLSF